MFFFLGDILNQSLARKSSTAQLALGKNCLEQKKIFKKKFIMV